MPAATGAGRLRGLHPDIDLAQAKGLGRPRALSIRTLLVGWMLVATTVTGDDKMMTNRVHSKLIELHPAARARLGISWTEADGASQTITLRQVRYLWKRMVEVVDGSEHFGGRELDANARAERDRARQRLVDGLLTATMPDDLGHAGSYSVDSTYLPSWAKPFWKRVHWGLRDHVATNGDEDDADIVQTESGAFVNTETGEVIEDELAETLLRLEPTHQRSQAQAEEQGAEDEGQLDGVDEHAEVIEEAERIENIRRGVARGDGTFTGISPADRAKLTNDPDARHRFMTKRTRTGRLAVKQDVFGYQITIAVRVRSDDGPPVPTLCERLVVNPGNHGEAEAAVDLLTRISESGQQLEDVVADRGFTYRRPDAFHIPVRRLGAQLVMDLHKKQRGLRGTYRGALLVDGGLYSPGFADSLFDLDSIQPGDTRATIEDKLAQFEWRQSWALKAIKRGLHERHACPAAGRDARVICPIKPTSLALKPATHQEVFPNFEAAAALPVCQQSSITVPLEVDAWRRQKHSFGTNVWWHSFKSRRNPVEGYFGNLKTPGTEHLHRGTTRAFGLAANTMLVGFLVAATNIRLLNTFKVDYKSTAAADDLFNVGDFEQTPLYRSGRRTRDVPTIRSLHQRGALIRRGDRPGSRKRDRLTAVSSAPGSGPS